MSPATITLIFLAFAIVMFVTEKIPLGLTSMIVCVGLCVTGVLDVKTAFAGYIDSNVILFVAMFIVGGAFFETGMANEIGGIVTKFAKSERSLIVAIMVIVGLMSGVLSNTGTAAVLIPVVIGIAAKSGFKRSRLLMPLVFAAAMGGNLSLIGAPGNMIAQSALEPLGLKFGFFEYAIVGLPILVCGILFYATIGFRLLPNHEVSEDDSSVFDEQKDFSRIPQWKKTLSLVILILTLAAMIFEDQIGIKLCISGCVGAILLILTGVISEKEALRSIDLKTIFLFGGTLSLAAALQDTGAGEMIAGKVIGALGSNPSPLIFTFVVFILCCVMTSFMSNTATTALMAPICLSIAQGMGADPRAVLMACVIGGGCTLPGNATVLMPGEGYEGITKFVLDRMTTYGLNACPPLLVGVGVGTSVETAALNSKKALMRPIGSHNDNANAAKMEKLLEDGINAIGLGPQGMGGSYSVMGVNIENTARHPSAIGVAVNVGCWSHRRGHIVFDKDLNFTVDTHTGFEYKEA